MNDRDIPDGAVSGSADADVADALEQQRAPVEDALDPEAPAGTAPVRSLPPDAAEADALDQNRDVPEEDEPRPDR